MGRNNADLPPESVPAGVERLRRGVSSLSAASRRIVTDRAARAALASVVVAGHPYEPAQVAAAVADFDAAALDVLDAAGLPRGPHVKGPFVTATGHGWAGRKAPDCSLFIDPETFRDLPDEDRPDSLFKTWVHESLHGRQPYSPGFAAEWRAYRGFEEGMVEGLARQLVVDGLGMRPVLASYSSYVDAYRALSDALGAPSGELWTALWELPAGELSEGFVPTVGTVLDRVGATSLSSRQQIGLFARARTVFASANAVRPPDGTMLVNLWREALQ